MKPEELMTIREVADELGMSTDFVLAEIQAGRLEVAIAVKRPGGRTHRKVSRQHLDEYAAVYCEGTKHRRISA